MSLLDSWILMAILTPTLWAVDCLVDSCLVGRQVYQRPLDGAIVACLFGFFPVLAVLGWHSHTADTAISLEPSAIAFMAGLAFALHLFCYFRILFRLNDVSGAETFLSLSVLVVPLFAWLLLEEVLPPRFYLAFLIAAAGVTVHCLSVFRRMGAGMLIDLFVCIVSVSLSMVLQAQALKAQGYAAATLNFNAACVLVALVPILCQRDIRSRILALVRRVPLVLLASQLLGLLAILSSHRASQYGPSVSIVALIECLLPMLIVAISLLVLGVNRLLPILPTDHRNTLALQVRGMPTKTLAVTLLLVSMSTLSG